MGIPIQEGFRFLKGSIKYHPTTNMKLEYLEKSDAVCIVVFDANLEKVLLVEQYRPGVDANTFEIVAGLIDGAEDPFEAVKRELREETGYEFNQLAHFVAMSKPLTISPGYTTEKLYYYGASLKEGEIPGNTEFDEGEDILSHWIKIEDVEDYLIDTKTLLAIQYFLPRIRKLKGGVV